MVIIDLSIVGLTVLMVAWGFRRGLTARTLALAGLGAGAVIGSHIAPLVLEGGLHSPFAPILALPGGLLCGALCAAALEWAGFRQRRRLRRLDSASGIGGAVLGGCLGVAAVLILGAAALQVESLRDPVRRSSILKRLHAVLPPPGPFLVAEAPLSDPFPTYEGPAPTLGQPDPRVAQDPAVRAAGRSVVRIETRACDGGGVGSGWIAADGIVATNAHVVAGDDPTITVQLGGRGKDYEATPIWFDRVNDLALLRTPGVRGVAALPLLREPAAGASAAILGFPGGRRSLSVRPARFGRATDRLRGRLGGRLPAPRFPRRLYGRPITVFAGRARPGNSGGPLVDTAGRVVTTVFGGGRRLLGFGVPNHFFRSALRRAGPPVDTGPC